MINRSLSLSYSIKWDFLPVCKFDALFVFIDAFHITGIRLIGDLIPEWLHHSQSTRQRVQTKAEHMKDVMNTKWNPRTRELTVIYDAKVTSARHIMHFMA